MALMTQIQFARHIERDKSHVTRLKQAGRLVMTVEGLVDVEPSLVRIQATRGSRYDVAERLEAQRREASAVEAGETTAPTLLQPVADAAAAADADPLAVDHIGRRTRYAQMLRAEAEARTKEREDALAGGAVIARAAVRADLETAVGAILNALAGVPDRVSPLVTGVADPGRVRSILSDEIEHLTRRVADELGALARSPAQ